ncbi:hypothetical protein BV25DRAFT_1843005 [Artomyces pyxidatus]|uniref:Uncharacterized protein n=1 Tax=Artomyces pyxidatus TaxID=48021 RepID=A0ACB8SHH8_9AGAM|nr:hypothetical protein BV25DRAFT_1843005 [Artomyces pyxidatus]
MSNVFRRRLIAPRGRTAGVPSDATWRANSPTPPPDSVPPAQHPTWVIAATDKPMVLAASISLSLVTLRAFWLECALIFARSKAPLEAEDKQLLVVTETALKAVVEAMDDPHNALGTLPVVFNALTKAEFEKMLTSQFSVSRAAVRHKWRELLFSSKSDPYGLRSNWDDRARVSAQAFKLSEDLNFIVDEDWIDKKIKHEDLASMRNLLICVEVWFTASHIDGILPPALAYKLARKLLPEPFLEQFTGTTNGYADGVPDTMVYLSATLIQGKLVLKKIEQSRTKPARPKAYDQPPPEPVSDSSHTSETSPTATHDHFRLAFLHNLEKWPEGSSEETKIYLKQITWSRNSDGVGELTCLRGSSDVADDDEEAEPLPVMISSDPVLFDADSSSLCKAQCPPHRRRLLWAPTYRQRTVPICPKRTLRTSASPHPPRAPLLPPRAPRSPCPTAVSPGQSRSLPQRHDIGRVAGVSISSSDLVSQDGIRKTRSTPRRDSQAMTPRAMFGPCRAGGGISARRKCSRRGVHQALRPPSRSSAPRSAAPAGQAQGDVLPKVVWIRSIFRSIHEHRTSSFRAAWLCRRPARRLVDRLRSAPPTGLAVEHLRVDVAARPVQYFRPALAIIFVTLHSLPRANLSRSLRKFIQTHIYCKTIIRIYQSLAITDTSIH